MRNGTCIVLFSSSVEYISGLQRKLQQAHMYTSRHDHRWAIWTIVHNICTERNECDTHSKTWESSAAATTLSGQKI